MRDDVTGALHPLLRAFDDLGDRLRLVGTASSLLRDIDLPVADIDVLARDRDCVDRFFALATEAGATHVSAPALLATPFGGQYIADLEVGGVVLQCSTVESTAATDSPRLRECVGDTPWIHFDLVEVRGHLVPVVASELRLASDVMRQRPDRWRPIAAHLAARGYDGALLAGAFVGFPDELTDDVWAVVGKNR